MRKPFLLFFVCFAAACSGKLPEQEVLKIFSRHSREELGYDDIAAVFAEYGKPPRPLKKG